MTPEAVQRVAEFAATATPNQLEKLAQHMYPMYPDGEVGGAPGSVLFEDGIWHVRFFEEDEYFSCGWDCCGISRAAIYALPNDWEEDPDRVKTTLDQIASV